MGQKVAKFDPRNNDSVELNQVFHKGYAGYNMNNPGYGGYDVNNSKNIINNKMKSDKTSKNQDEENNKNSVITPGVLEKENDEETDKPKPPEKPSFIKQLLSIIVMIVLLIESAYSTYVAYQGYKGFNNLSDSIKEEVTNNFGYNMISDLQVQSSCNGEWEGLFSYMFQGTNNRCDCRAVGGSITPGFCMPDQSNCKYYGFLSEKLLLSYPFGPNDDVKTELCVKYYRKDTFATIKSWPSTCPNGQKRCGGSTPNSMICMPQDELCPINAMVVTPVNPDPTIYTEQITFNSTHTLFYSRTSGNQPINYSKVTSGEGPCYDINKDNTYSGRVDHFTYKVQRTVCTVDNRWQRLAEVGEYTYWKSNDVVPEDYFKELWAEDPISDQYRYGFYLSHYPDWKYDFRNQLSTITTFAQNRDKIMTYQTGLFGLAAFALVQNTVFAVQLVLHFIRKGSEEEKLQFDKKKDAFANMVKIAQIGLCIYQIINIQDYVDAFFKCIENKVSDPRTNSILSAIGNYLHDKVLIQDKNLIISNCIGLVLALLCFLYTLYTLRKNAQKNDSK